jgi:hypothetical protein
MAAVQAGVLVRALAAVRPAPGRLSVLPGPGQVRFKRINIQRPHRPSWFRQQLLAVSKPRWEDEVAIEDLPEHCEQAEQLEERKEWQEHINQLERFYVAEMMEMFGKSQMIAFFHTNPIREADWRKAWQVRSRSYLQCSRLTIFATDLLFKVILVSFH